MLKFEEFRCLNEEYIKEPNSQLGSNYGGIFTDSDNEKHYIKFPKNPEQAKVEVATSKIFNHLGINTFSPELEHMSKGTVGVKSKWNPNVSRIHESEFKDHINEIPKFKRSMLDLYHASALTGNWDVIGSEYDNVLKHNQTGEVHAVDQGGSMHFRAQGEPKEFSGDDVPELKTLLHPRRPSGIVFGHALSRSTPEEIKSSRNKLHTLTDEHIDNIIEASGLDKKHADIIKSRRDKILGK